MTGPHEGARGPAATGPDAQGTTDAEDSACPADKLQRDPDRQFQDYRAKLALRGHELYRIEGAGFLVRRWGLSKELRDLDAVGQFAAQVNAL